MMDPHTVLIADSSQEFCEELKNILRWICNAETCTSGTKVLSMLSQLHPDVLLLDLMLPELDGISVLKALDSSGSRPAILASTCLVTDYILETAQSLNISYLLVKPCDVHATAARIEELLKKVSVSEDPDEDCSCQISSLLIMMGFSVKLNGFRYLQQAVYRILKDPDQSITKELYPGVGHVYGTLGSHVERSIRGAIQDAWKHRDDRIWQLYFPPDSNGEMAKPTNAVFITRIADGLRISLNTKKHLEFIPSENADSSAMEC